jgi:serine protease Do
MRWLIVLCSALFSFTGVWAQSKGEATSEKFAIEKFSAKATPAVIEKALTGLVKLRTLATPGAKSTATLGNEREGNGILLSPRLVLTIGYLIMEADEVEIIDHKGRKLPGKVAGFDGQTGFGLVRLLAPAQGEPMQLGDAKSLKEKDAVLAAGAYGNIMPAFVTSKREFTGGWEYLLEEAIFTFPPISDWGGAALIAPSGKLVGVGSLYVRDAYGITGGMGGAAGNSAGVPGNMFVPIDILKPILDDLIEGGQRKGAQRPWLGITTFEDVDGVNVGRLSKDGPGDTAGVERGDVITAVGNTSVKTLAEFYRAVWARGDAGVRVPLTVKRGRSELNVNVKSVDRVSQFATRSAY